MMQAFPPAFSRFLQAAEEWLDGRSELEPLSDALTAHQQALEAWSQAAMDRHVPGQRQAELEAFCVKLTGLREHLAQVSPALLERADFGLEAYAGSLKELLDQWSALRHPRVFSRLSPVERLVRAVYRFRQETLPESELQGAVAAFLSWHESLELPSELEQAHLVSEHNRAVRLLERAMHKRDPDLLEVAARRLSRWTEQLFPQLEDSLEPPDRALELGDQLEELRHERLTAGEDLEEALQLFRAPGGASWSPTRRTPLESCDTLIEQVQGYFSGNAVSETLLPALESFESEVDLMHEEFHRERCFRVDDKEIHGQAGEVYEVYRLLYEALDELHLALEHEARSPALRAASLAAEMVESLFELYAGLRAKEHERPRFSQATHVDELARVARSCLAGGLGWDSLQLRLEAFTTLYRSFASDFESQELGGGLWGLSQDQRQVTEEALGRIGTGLESLETFLHEGGEERIPAALEELRLGAESLLAVQARTQPSQSESTPTVCCLHCGASNSPQMRLCQKCGAVMPFDLSTRNEPGRSLHSESSADVEPFAGLSELVEGVVAGSIQPETLRGQLEDLRRRCQAVPRLLEGMGPIPKGLSPEMEACLSEARTTVTLTQAQMVEVLEEMLEGIACQDYPALVPLVGKLTDAVQGTHRLRDLTQEARQHVEAGTTP